MPCTKKPAQLYTTLLPDVSTGADDFSELCRLMRELRRRHGMTLREAAAQIGVSHTRLGDYERGKTHGSNRRAVPSRETLVRIASAYQYPSDVLIGLAGYSLEPPPPAKRHTRSEAALREVEEIYLQLTEDQQDAFLDVARAFRKLDPGASTRRTKS